MAVVEISVACAKSRFRPSNGANGREISRLSGSVLYHARSRSRCCAPDWSMWSVY